MKFVDSRPSKIAFVLSLLFLVSQIGNAQGEVSREAQNAAQYHGATALDQLSEGNLGGAMQNLKKAIDLNPYALRWRVEYTRLLQAQAQGAFKVGNLALGRQLFKAAEKEMLVSANILVGQNNVKEAAGLYFNIGQLNEQIFQKKRTAYAYYQKASQLDPTHTQAAASIRALSS